MGDVIEVVTERLAYGGDAVARYSGLTVFIPFAAPDEKLRVRVTERKKNYARAIIEEIIEPSSARRDPPCQYFGNCGGCQLQHMTYEAQLEAKAGFIRDALQRISHMEVPGEIKNRSANEYAYRARAQVKIEPAGHSIGSTSRAIGFNRVGSHSVCDVEHCLVLVPELDRALGSLRSTVNQAGAQEGHPRISEVEIAAGEQGVAFEPEIAATGSVALQHTVHGISYRFDAGTFFQINAFLLDDLVDEAVKDYSGRLAIDLYAGVGLFTLQLARRFRRVVGIESDRRACRFARENIRANGASNVDFFNERTESWLKNYIATGAGEPPDLVLLDPPRAGAADAVSFIAAIKPARISYVSCDPTTLARDLRSLVDSGYELETVTAVDLFPQTYHIETVASLRRSKG